ncbi:MAG: competence/damage-inducible protein A [Deltaproteobacteria bacterium]|nr:competence/damage-inducible protein A [Deltaproteobacteria bacterium]
MTRSSALENRAEILTIGDELVSGETIDTSSNELDKKLEVLGWIVERHTTVRDVELEIAAAIREAAARSRLLVCSGGLGPTDDDLTLAGLARALGVELTLHQPTLDAIAERFRSIGRSMTPNNERQARVPSRGEVLPNPVGTAPAFRAELDGCEIFLLPGVPREMRWLFDNSIAPRVARGASSTQRRTIRVMGLGESRLEHEVRELVRAHPHVRFGYRTLGAENHVKLAAGGELGAQRLAEAEAAVRSLLGARAFGIDDQDLPSVVGALLESRQETVCAAESCTGGLILELLTERAGASSYVLGGCVTYSNAAKISLVGVRAESLELHGAVSEQVAKEMAEGVRERVGATHAVASTGIAGPSGGTAEKPVGTVFVAAASASGTDVRKLRLPGDRAQIRRGTALSALDLLRRRILNEAAGLELANG